MQQNGFVFDVRTKTLNHPNGMSYTGNYVNLHHTKLFVTLVAEKMKGNLKVAKQRVNT